MLIPKRVKYQKQMRGRMKGIAGRGNKVSFGEFGLQALEPHWITSRQIEATRAHDCASYEAAWTILDSHLSRQARHCQTGGDAYGQGQRCG